MSLKTGNSLARIICLVLGVLMLLVLVLPVVSFEKGIENGIDKLSKSAVASYEEAEIILVIAEAVTDEDLVEELLDAVSGVKVSDYNLTRYTPDVLEDIAWDYDDVLYEEFIEVIEYALEDYFYYGYYDEDYVEDVLVSLVSSPSVQSILAEWLVYNWAYTCSDVYENSVAAEDGVRNLVRFARAVKDGKLSLLEFNAVFNAVSDTMDMMLYAWDLDAADVNELRQDRDSGDAWPEDLLALAVYENQDTIKLVQIVYILFVALYALAAIGVILFGIMGNRRLAAVFGICGTICMLFFAVAIWIVKAATGEALYEFVYNLFVTEWGYGYARLAEPGIYPFVGTGWPLFGLFVGLCVIALSLFGERLPVLSGAGTKAKWTCSCGNVCDAGMAFCPVCGGRKTAAPSALKCAGCGAKLAPGARFCPVCGRAAASHVCEEELPGKRCTNCGCRMEEDMMFCPECSFRVR